MRYFVGKHYHTLDAKGRLSIPSKFRKATGEVLILTRGLDGCLFLYPMERWLRFVDELMTLPATAENPRYFMREVATNANEVTVDSHGRIIVPAELRELAGLEREVVVAGVFDHIEIWNPTKFDEYRAGFGRSFEQVSETLHKIPATKPDDGEEAGKA